METSSVLIAEPTSPSLGVLPLPIPAKQHSNERRTCRVCGSARLTPYLNLGKQALANALRDPHDTSAEARYPLVVQACAQCKLSQLTYVVPKETLYTSYAYSSGVSAGWREHCTKLAEEYGRAGTLTLDIASNDGTLVRAFAAQGCHALGIEPSSSFADCVYARHKAWWSVIEASLLADRYDIITAQNVLGHVDDVHDFMAGISLALASNGVAIIEVPYVGDMLESCAFDTVYHEHLSYWSVTALKRLCEAHGLTLRDVYRIPVHGGAIRAIIGHGGPVHARLASWLVGELHDFKRSLYESFSARVTRRIAEINTELVQHTPYVGFGAAAKTAIMLGCLDVRAFPRLVYDETPAKVGKTIPGTRVPIEAPFDPDDWRTAPGPLCIFAWNWAPSIIKRLRKAGYTGAIFTPLPKPRWDYAQ